MSSTSAISSRRPDVISRGLRSPGGYARTWRARRRRCGPRSYAQTERKVVQPRVCARRAEGLVSALQSPPTLGPAPRTLPGAMIAAQTAASEPAVPRNDEFHNVPDQDAEPLLLGC